MKKKPTRGIKRQPCHTKLFRFTDEDEYRMALAIALSIRFMKSYGKGRRPGRLVDNYERY